MPSTAVREHELHENSRLAFQAAQGRSLANVVKCSSFLQDLWVYSLDYNRYRDERADNTDSAVLLRDDVSHAYCGVNTEIYGAFLRTSVCCTVW